MSSPEKDSTVEATNQQETVEIPSDDFIDTEIKQDALRVALSDAFLEKVFEDDTDDELDVHCNCYDSSTEAANSLENKGFENARRKMDEKRIADGIENKMIETVGDVVKVIRPFKAIRANLDGKGKFSEIVNDPIHTETPVAESIARKYGASNYSHSIGLGMGGTYFKNDGLSSLSKILPDLDCEILLNKDVAAKKVEIGKKHCEENKDKMESQMNVVAFYSVKDSKPFYYVSSAEARLAINYINLCRQFKYDVVTETIGFIQKYIHRIDEIIKSIKSYGDVPISIVWQKDLLGIVCEDEEYELSAFHSSQIVSICKRSFIPVTEDDKTFYLNEFEVRTGLVSNNALMTLIDFHSSTNGCINSINYVICGKGIFKVLTCDRSKVYQPSHTEREIFGVADKLKTSMGDVMLFVNEKLPDNAFAIVMAKARIMGDEPSDVIISQYIVEKSYYADVVEKNLAM